jgi:hypothetical protein
MRTMTEDTTSRTFEVVSGCDCLQVLSGCNFLQENDIVIDDCRWCCVVKVVINSGSENFKNMGSHCPSFSRKKN